MSRGARRMPARPAALTAAKRDVNGEGEERMSRPPTEEGVVIRAGASAWRDMPGSGRARRAQIRERVKEVIVERRMEWMNVVFAPFQTPQAPSLAQR